MKGRFLLALAVSCLAAACREEKSSLGVIETSVGASVPRDLEGAVAPTRITSIVLAELGDSLSSAIISDIALRDDGDMYVTDPNSRRVWQIAASGTLVRNFGHLGSDPSGMRSPMRIATAGSAVLVYDMALKRFIEFDTTGQFVRAESTPSDWRVGDLGVDGRGRFIASYVTSSQMIGIGQYPQTRQALQLSTQLEQGGIQTLTRPTPGALCGRRTSTLLSNSLAYQIVEFAVDNFEVVSDFRPATADFKPVAMNTGRGPTMSVVELGLVCSDAWFLYAFMDVRDRSIVYDLHVGGSFTRHRFVQSIEASRPGVPVAVRDSVLITFRNKPRPRIDFFQLAKPRADP